MKVCVVLGVLLLSLVSSADGWHVDGTGMSSQSTSKASGNAVQNALNECQSGCPAGFLVGEEVTCWEGEPFDGAGFSAYNCYAYALCVCS